MTKFLLAMLVSVSMVALTACDQSPEEKAADAVEQIQEGTENYVDAVQESVKDAAEETEAAVDEAIDDMETAPADTNINN